MHSKNVTPEYLTPKQAAKIAGLSTMTLRRYADKGKLNAIRIPNGDRRYDKKEILALIGQTYEEENTVFYARASDGNEKLIQTQIHILENQLGKPTKIYTDKASGLNENRRALKQLMKEAQHENITTIAVTDKDRLTRFGFTYLEEYFTLCGAKIVVVNDNETKTLHEELLEDFMSLLASFSGKFYRLRGYDKQQKFLKDVEGQLNEKTSKPH